MDLAQQVALLTARGFTEERSQTLVLMREATILLFDAFPDILVLAGGANLVLFQGGVRHSADLDFFPLSGGELPTATALRDTLHNGLQPLARLMNLKDLTVNIVRAGEQEIQLLLMEEAKKALFSVDITRIDSVFQSGVEECDLEGTGTHRTATVKFVSREQMLLMKAQVLLLRRGIRARDAYDAMDLMEKGVTLGAHAKSFLADLL